MSEEELKNLWALVESVTRSRTKASARPQLERLRFQVAQIRGKVDPYTYGKLQEVICHAKAASGSVPDKDREIYFARMSWSVFEMNALRSADEAQDELKEHLYDNFE